MRGQRARIKGFNAQTQVIHVAPFRTGRNATLAADFTIHRHQINQCIAGAQLGETDVITLALQRTAQHVAIKAHHARHVDGTQHHVIQAENAEHRLMA